MFNKLVFYETKTGKVVNDMIEEAIQSRKLDKQPSGIAVMSADKAIINNGYVQNMPSRHVTHDIMGYVKRKQDQNNRQNLNDPMLMANLVNERRKNEELRQKALKDNPFTPQEEAEIDKSIQIVGDRRYRQQTDANIVRRTPSQQPAPKYRNPQINQARQMSKQQVKQSQERNRNQKKQFDLSELPKWFIALLVAAGILVSGLTLATEQIVERIGGINDYYQYETQVRSFIKNDDSLGKPTIVSKHTHYPVMANRDNYWLDNEAIALEILKCPDEMFDATLFSVYVDMGNDRENAYINNFSKVIYYLNEYATPEKNPLAYARVHDSKTFDAFLENNFWTLEEYESLGKKAISVYADDFEDINEERGR